MTAHKNVTCKGGNNGAAVVTTGGGSGAYTYSWVNNTTSSEVSTLATASGLTAGTYTVTLKDAADETCTETVTVTITEPEALTLSEDVTAHKNVTCKGGNNGAAVVTTGGGSGAYTYSWVNNTTSSEVSTLATASGLTAGTYTVTIADAADATCTKTATVTITEPEALTLSEDMTAHKNVTCNSGNNGAAAVTAGGGSGAYTYSWVNNTTSSVVSTTATASGLTAGTYTVTLKDAVDETCSITETVTITEPTALTLTEDAAAHVNVLCNGRNTGAAAVTVGGGSGSYTYSWKNTSNVEVSALATASGLTAGTYTVTIADVIDATCSKVTNVTITEPTAITLGKSTTPVKCNGGNDGTATVVPTGGSGSYTYNWSNGMSTATAEGLTANTYTVTVADAADATCTVSETLTVTQPDALLADITFNNINCVGDNVGSISINNVRGGNGSYKYEVSGPSTIAQTNWTSNVTTPANLPVGNYTVTVTDAKGCPFVQSGTISYLYPQIEVSATVTRNVTCPTTAVNYSSNAIVSANVSGGNGMYTYAWTTSSKTTATIDNSTDGPGTVTVTDGNGCKATANYNVLPATEIEGKAIVTPATSYRRTDGLVTVEASVTSGGYQIVSGQLVSYQYALQDASGNWVTNTEGITYDFNSPAALTGAFTALPQGTYTIWARNSIATGSDSYDCDCYSKMIVAAAVVVGAPEEVTGSVDVTDPKCHEGQGSTSGSELGSAVVTINGGGTAPYQVTVNGETKQVNSAGGTATFENLAPGTYSVTVTDAATPVETYSLKDKDADTVVYITVKAPDSIAITKLSTAGRVCQYDELIFTATANSAMTSYVWTGADATTTTTNTNTVATDAGGLKHVTVYGVNANGCRTAVREAESTVIELPAAPSVTDFAACQSSGTKAWTDLAKVVTPGSRLQWYSDANGTTVTTAPDFIDLSVSGERTVYVGAITATCRSEEVVAVNSNIHVIPSFVSITELGDLTTEVTVNGVPTFTYLLDAGRKNTTFINGGYREATDEFDGTVNLGMLAVGSHTLKISDEIGCSCDTVIKIAPTNLVPDKFFTPNGDGVNDRWLIRGGIERFPETVIYLYDRYGKELAKTKALDFRGWDGKYNGKDMPSTDYWYIIEIKETGERIVGHFLLKR